MFRIVKVAITYCTTGINLTELKQVIKYGAVFSDVICRKKFLAPKR